MISFKSITLIILSLIINLPIIKATTFGVQTHFAQFDNQDVIPLIKDSGILYIRDEQYWNHIETVKGIFNYPEKFTNYMSSLKSNNIEPLLILNWSNRYYDYEAGDFTFPHTIEGRTAFVNYALNILKKYPEVKAVEVWNEVNAGTFIKGPATTDKAKYYVELLKVLYPAIKSVRPDVTVIAGATVPIVHGFFHDLVNKGALPYMDAVSVHAYVQPEVLVTEIETLKQITGKPVWITEFAPSTTDVLLQADQTAQLVALICAAGVERAYYYLMIADGGFKHLGLVDTNFHPRPVYYSYKEAIEKLSNKKFIKRLSSSPSTYLLEFENTLVAWSNEPTELLVNDLPIKIGRKPIYIEKPFTTVIETNNSVITDAVSAYSNKQGNFGWYYGHAYVVGCYKPEMFQKMNWGIFLSDNYRWLGISTYHFLTTTGFHPDGVNWAVKRWQSNYTGEVILKGEISRGGGGDGCDAVIYLNGQQIFSKYISPSSKFTYEIPITLKDGDLIDYCVGPRGTNTNDATNFSSKIIKIEKDKIRFFPRNYYEYRMVGGTFEGSNSLNGPWTLIYTINNIPERNKWQEITVDLGDWKFLRYSCTNYTNVAEIEFWRGSTKVVGKPFGRLPVYLDSSLYTPEKVFDGDTSTFYNYYQGPGGFVGIGE